MSYYNPKSISDLKPAHYKCLVRSFNKAKAICEAENIAHSLTLEQYIQMWLDSGKVNNRRFKDADRHVMVRKDRTLAEGFSAENTHIIHWQESKKDAFPKPGEKRKPSTCRKISKAKAGVPIGPQAPEHVAQRAAALSKQPKSETHCSGISEGMKAYWARRKANDILNGRI